MITKVDMSAITRLRRALLALACFPVAAVAADNALVIELNKLEDAGEACRAYMVFENKTDSAYGSLKLDLVMFAGDGVIAKRLAVEGGPLQKGKTSVKLFEISGLPCANIGRVLLNDVISCRDAEGEHDDCVERVTTASRGSVPFFK